MGILEDLLGGAMAGQGGMGGPGGAAPARRRRAAA